MPKHLAGRKKKLLLLCVFIVAATAILAAIHIHNVHVAQSKSGGIPSVKKGAVNKTSSGKDKSTIGSNVQPNNSDKTTVSAGSSATLITPSGTFVSNHRPGQNGTSTQEVSVCNTNSGAVCVIRFTNSQGVTKDLGAKKTDSNGAAYWQWDVQGANLAPGKWKIVAVATLNGQSKTASDNLDLEIQ